MIGFESETYNLGFALFRCLESDDFPSETACRSNPTCFYPIGTLQAPMTMPETCGFGPCQGPLTILFTILFATSSSTLDLEEISEQHTRVPRQAAGPWEFLENPMPQDAVVTQSLRVCC